VSRDSLIDFFHDLARARGQFLVYDDGFRTRSYSYAEVGGAARGFAARLADAGVRKGDAVVFWSENRPEWIVAFWGCLLSGIVVVPIDYRSSPEFLARISRKVAARLVLIGEDVPPAKEFFKAHFFPKEHGRRLWLGVSLAYYLAALVFNAFPLPQREAGARQRLRYIGDLLEDGCSVLIFPEGHHTDTGDIDRFRAGIGMIASRLDAPVVPVRLEGVDRVLHRSWHMARPGHVRVAFGAPMRLAGEDYEALARQVEEAVRALLS